MGQQMGKMPETLAGLVEERDRVLHWSGEILAKVDDNVQNEDTFLMNYNAEKVKSKAQQWFNAGKSRVAETWGKFPNAGEQCKNSMKEKVEKYLDELVDKLTKQYESAYSDIEKFTKKVDKFGKEELKIHEEIQKVENESGGDVGKFIKKFGPLRVKVFKNLETGEKFMFEDKRLKDSFVKKVHEIDQKMSHECTKKFDKFVKEIEKCAAK